MYELFIIVHWIYSLNNNKKIFNIYGHSYFVFVLCIIYRKLQYHGVLNSALPNKHNSNGFLQDQTCQIIIALSLRIWSGVSCGGHHGLRGKTTTGSALDGAVFDIAQILAYLVHNMSRSQLYFMVHTDLEKWLNLTTVLKSALIFNLPWKLAIFYEKGLKITFRGLEK